MKKTTFVRLFLYANLSAFLCEALGEPLVDRAEAFRAELSAQHMIIDRDPELGSARSIAYMAKDFYGAFEASFKQCGLQGVEDTPDRVKSNAINTFAVSFRGRGDRPCNGFRDAATCDYLRNNCITLGNAVFCDYDYLLFQRNLARASFAYTHIALTIKPDIGIETVAFVPFSPDLLVDFATYQTAAKPLDIRESTAGLTPSVRAAIGYEQKYGSVVAEAAEFAVLGAVIGHEIAHVESNACPIDHHYNQLEESIRQDVARELGIRIYSRDTVIEIARDYRDMTCHRALSEAELAADLRGIEMLGVVLWVQYQLWRLGYADATADRATAELWRLRTATAVIALAQALEYELIVSAEPMAAAAQVRGEEGMVDNRLVFQYYLRLANERTKHEFASNSLMRGQRHMHPSYRAGLLLEVVGLPSLYDQRRKFGFKIGFPIRLYGYLLGSLQTLQVLACSQEQAAAESRAQDFLRRISGTHKDEYLVDYIKFY